VRILISLANGLVLSPRLQGMIEFFKLLLKVVATPKI